MIYTYLIDSPVGNLGLSLYQNKLSCIEFLGEHQPKIVTEDAQDNAVLQNIISEIQTYFQQPAHVFTLSLHIEGTLFQQKVWEALRQIPAGHTLSYGELARQLKTSPRAIGNACRANRIPLVIPCHRITAKNNLGGFSGKTSGQFFAIKKWLLQHEAF